MLALISGSSGFIGSNLVALFRRQDIEVKPIPRWFLYDPKLLLQSFNELKPDIIINCASYGNMSSHNNDAYIINANIIALHNLLESSRRTRYQAFLNFSSSSVNLSYETMYSATKAAGERIVKAFVNKYNKPVFTIRPYTVIGKGEQRQHLIPQLIESCLTGKEIPFVPSPKHDFVGIDDFCKAILTILDPKFNKCSGDVIEIGSGHATSNQEVLEMVERVTGKKANVKIVESLRSYDNESWCAKMGVPISQSLEQIIRTML